MKEKRAVPSLEFPPYGLMNNDDLKSLGSKHLVGSPTEPIVPPHFREPATCKGLLREQCWNQFRDGIVDAIADALWPVWDVAGSTWTGAAVKNMERLTQADLKILMGIRVGSHLPINSIPSATPRALNCPAHITFFQEEDQSKIFASYGSYDQELEPQLVSAFGDIFFSGINTKCSSTQYQFKHRLQRPRPYQMAFVMGNSDFNLEEAITSMTPSMISGHSLQGLLGTGAVMERIVLSGMKFSKDSWQALRQYAVDIGDRRVMAGVHYPSDNLASWIVTMAMANHIYESAKIKEMLWLAITEQSRVYKLIQDSGSDAYSSGLRLLERM